MSIAMPTFLMAIVIVLFVLVFRGLWIAHELTRELEGMIAQIAIEVVRLP